MDETEKNIKTHFLSQEERDTGRKYFSTFTLFNGLGFGFLADTTVYLLAIHFGASNIQLGYISSIIYLSGIMLIFSPKIIADRDLIRVFFWAWLLRGFVCLINAAVLFTSGQIAVAVILISYTLFCTSRIIGASLNNPVIQMISTPSNLGDILTHNTAYYNFGSILGKIASFAIMSITAIKGLIGLMILQGLGVMFNTIACVFLRRVPCREKIEITPGQNLIALFIKGLSEKKKLIPLVLFWNNLSMMVFAGFTIPLLRKTIGLEENIVFLYTIATAIAATCAMYMIRPFIDKVSLKPFVLSNAFFNVILFALWACIGRETPVYAIFILGSVFMFLNGINQSVVNRILISSIPHKNKVNYNSMVYFIAGILALTFGIAAGALGDVGDTYHPGPFNHYYLIFAAGMLLSAVTFFLGTLMDGRNPDFFRKPQDLVKALGNMKSLFDVYHFDTAKSSEERKSILMSLKYTSAPFALEEIRKILKNPLSSETEEVLKSLFAKPRTKLLPDILDCANDRGFYHRATAIFALGAYPDPEVKRALVNFLGDETPRIRSNAAKSLARVGGNEYLDEIIKLSRDADNTTWDILNYVIAVMTIDRKSPFIGTMFDIADRQGEKSYKQAVFSVFSRMLECRPELNLIYQNENLGKFKGLRMLLDEARQFQVFYRNTSFISDSFTAGDYPALWKLFRGALEGLNPDPPYSFIRDSIAAYDETKADAATTLAMIYFSFFILIDETD
jgi:hypothetical protein